MDTTSPGTPPPRALGATLIALVLVAVWAGFSWNVLRPDSIVNDWGSWREADTQQMALNAMAPDARFNVPRINWGGPQPAAVEAEFQGYAELAAALMTVTGPGEGPSLLLSLVLGVIGAVIVFLWLRRRLGDVAALFGLATWLASRNTLFLGMSIQPDGLGLTAFVAALYAFDLWAAHRAAAPASWIGWVGATTLSALIKPLNLQLGIVQFLVAAFQQRALLRRPALWAGWLVILALTAWQLWHGVQSHHQTGLTFGVISGGDDKRPALVDLVHPGNYLQLVMMSVHWGLQPVGIVAGLFLLLRRRLDTLEVGLFVGYVVSMIYAMRYAVWAGGAHYHASAHALAALLVAHAVHETRQHLPRMHAPVAALAVALIAGQFGWNVHAKLCEGRGRIFDLGYVQGADALRPSIPPGTPIAVRSEAPREVEGWRGGDNNFEDPRYFYLLQTAGWVVPRDAEAPGDLETPWRAGARWYIEPVDTRPSDAQLAWLKEHGTLVVDLPQVRGWRLAPVPAPG